jgi:hypothetical protein
MSALLESMPFDYLTEQAHWAIFYGFGVAELNYAKDGAQVVLLDAVDDAGIYQGLKIKDRRRFVFHREDGLRMLTQQASFLGESLPQRKFWVLSTGSQISDDPHGLGLAYLCYYPNRFRRDNFKNWLRYGDKVSKNQIYGRTPHSDGKKREEFRKVVNALREGGSGVIDEEEVIEMLDMATNSSDYAVLDERIDNALAKIILGQVGTSEGVAGQHRGDMQRDVRQDFVSRDSYLITDAWNRGPGAWLTNWNFPGAVPPILSRQVEGKPSPEEQSDNDAKIFAFGWTKNLEQVSEHYGEGYLGVGKDNSMPAIPVDRLPHVLDLLSKVASGELTVDQGRKLALYMLPGYTEEMINELVVEPPEEPDAGPLFDEAIAGAGGEEEPAFALFGKGSRPGQKKCVTGKTCGNSCISKNKECRKKPPEKAVEAVKEAAKSLEPEAFYDYELTRWTSHGKEWAAKLTDFEGVDGFKREFADVVSRNWSRSGKNGTTTVRLQGEGFYEVSDPSTGRYGTDARSFIEFRNGEIFTATRAEVVAHLESQGKKKLSIEEKKKELSLPELSGSEKQIAWAEKIRAQTLEKFDSNFDYWARRVTFLNRPNMESARAELRQMVLDDLTSKIESRWWIDAREQGNNGFINSVGLRRFFDPDRILALRSKYIPLEAEFAIPDQDDIDLYGLDLQEQASKTINQWLGQIRELGKDSADLPEFAARIYDLYPDLSGQALTEVMAQAQMAASWIGADDAQGGDSPEFAAKTKACKTGKTCGNSCISKNKECRKKAPEKAVKAVKAVASQLAEKDEPDDLFGGLLSGLEDSVPSPAEKTPTEKITTEEEFAELFAAAEKLPTRDERQAAKRALRERRAAEEKAEKRRVAQERSAQYEPELRAKGGVGGAPNGDKADYIEAIKEKFAKDEDFKVAPIATGVAGTNIKYRMEPVAVQDVLPRSLNKEAVEEILSKSSGRAYDVIWDVYRRGKELDVYGGDADKFDKDEALKVALTARRGWKDKIQGRLKEGDLLMNTPSGGKDNPRAKAYERQGFSKVHENGYQYAIVGKGGKLIPIQFGDLA